MHNQQLPLGEVKHVHIKTSLARDAPEAWLPAGAPLLWIENTGSLHSQQSMQERTNLMTKDQQTRLLKPNWAAGGAGAAPYTKQAIGLSSNLIDLQLVLSIPQAKGPVPQDCLHLRCLGLLDLHSD